MNNDELRHYGILGMRWGHRRANSLIKKANSYKRSGDMASYKQTKVKAESIRTKHKKLAGRAYDYSNKESIGKSIAKSLLFGTHGALKYNEARAKGVGRGKAAVKASLHSLANLNTLGVYGVVEPRVSSRNR